VFAVTKRHAETLARLFDDAFADRKRSPEVRYADYVVNESWSTGVMRWRSGSIGITMVMPASGTP